MLAFGREQVLVSRDTLGLAEGLVAAPGGGPSVTGALTLTDARGYAFPVLVAAGETRIFNSRVTNLCGHLAELLAAGVSGVIVAQADLSGDERRAFAGTASADSRPSTIASASRPAISTAGSPEPPSAGPRVALR